MCGRYTIKDVKAAAIAYGVAASVLESIGPRFNVAPSQMLPVIRPEGDGVTGELMKWGLVPFWDKSEKPKIAPINARVEDVLSKPAFRQSVQKRRCLVVADGFFEWQKLDEHTKVPFHIQLRGGHPFSFAGIYEAATDLRPASFAILTTGPNSLTARIHNRMPLILSPTAEKRWLAPGSISASDIDAFATPLPSEEMEAFPVSRLVNNTRNDAPGCVELVPIEQAGEDGGQNSR